MKEEILDSEEVLIYDTENTLNNEGKIKKELVNLIKINVIRIKL